MDTLDQLLNRYTCKRKINNWPVILFCNKLDTSASNAFLQWTSIHSKCIEIKLTKRKLFWEELKKSLIFPHTEARQHLPRSENWIKVNRRIEYRIKLLWILHCVSNVQGSSSIHQVTKLIYWATNVRNTSNLMWHHCKFHVKYYCIKSKKNNFHFK